MAFLLFLSYLIGFSHYLIPHCENAHETDTVHDSQQNGIHLHQHHIEEGLVDKDQEHDFDAETIQEGYFGINIHRSNPRRESTVVNNWSLGCQVFANPDQFSEFMNICYKAMNIWGNNFTYTLINECDFSDHSN